MTEPAMERWATFDCYGTLVDWDRGIGRELGRLWPEADRACLLGRYHEIEPRVELDGSLRYRQVLAEALRLLAESEGLELASADEQALGNSLPRWPVFGEVPDELEALRARGWRLGILSNTDPDLLAATLQAIPVPIDATITAREAGSYKPVHGHWLRFRERDDVEPARHVHVAASAFHDIAPAAELGIPAVWINRLDEGSELPRAGELPTLSGLADLLDRLRPG